MNAVSVQGLSKNFTIGQRAAYGSLRDEIVQAVSAPFRWLRRSEGARTSTNSLWALDDVSFDVSEGEVLGIIGGNGAGKSTLLKILSRITEPTLGEVRIRGRVASLLEVGTGFHPELTGRENIFLNGSLLGMRASEIRNRFDDIVAFSEIEGFLDTPVKRYSSGMYVRLAFAVAAHLEPEILIVDEVLAVGDVAFQKKCLGKMSDVASGGRTVLFVSHNMAAVRKLCSRAIVLKNGKVDCSGPVDTAVESYLEENEFAEGCGPVHIRKDLSAAHESGFVVESIEVVNKNGEGLRDLKTGDSILLRIHYVARRRFMGAEFSVSCKSEWGEEIFSTTTSYGVGDSLDQVEGPGALELTVNDLPLLGGTYYLDLALAREGVSYHFVLERAVQLEFRPTDVYNSGRVENSRNGFLAVSHAWQHKR